MPSLTSLPFSINTIQMYGFVTFRFIFLQQLFALLSPVSFYLCINIYEWEQNERCESPTSSIYFIFIFTDRKIKIEKKRDNTSIWSWLFVCACVWVYYIYIMREKSWSRRNKREKFVIEMRHRWHVISK
jgi:hypothetical protein